jgi:hypothetical protein
MLLDSLRVMGGGVVGCERGKGMRGGAHYRIGRTCSTDTTQLAFFSIHSMTRGFQAGRHGTP